MDDLRVFRQLAHLDQLLDERLLVIDQCFDVLTDLREPFMILFRKIISEIFEDESELLVQLL